MNRSSAPSSSKTHRRPGTVVPLLVILLAGPSSLAPRAAAAPLAGPDLSTAQSPSSPSPGEPEAARRGQSAVEPDEPPLDVTFRVRSTERGRGFLSGSDGRLRISQRGISFVPDDGSDGERWTVSWETLASAEEAEGIWDVPHPLVIETDDGTRRFLAEMSRDGHFEDGRQVLAYIEKGRVRYGAGPA